MRKLYILFFSCLFIWGFSQTQAMSLSTTSWKIVKIQQNNVDYYPPISLSDYNVAFDYIFNKFFSSYYNTTSGTLTFGSNNANHFSLENVVITLGEYSGENEQAVQQFDSMSNYFYVGFQPTDKFHFEYQEVMLRKNLVVTNPNGNKIFYSNMILGTSETSKQKISVYPNPAIDIIKIENLKPNSSLELIDSSGKLVKTISNSKSTKTEVNIKNLPSGIYYLKVDGHSAQKIIKK